MILHTLIVFLVATSINYHLIAVRFYIPRFFSADVRLMMMRWNGAKSKLTLKSVTNIVDLSCLRQFNYSNYRLDGEAAGSHAKQISAAFESQMKALMQV